MTPEQAVGFGLLLMVLGFLVILYAAYDKRHPDRDITEGPWTPLHTRDPYTPQARPVGRLPTAYAADGAARREWRAYLEQDVDDGMYADEPEILAFVARNRSR